MFRARQAACLKYKDGVSGVAFGPDGELLATGTADKTAQVQPWRSEDLLNGVCTRLTRNLTREEWRRNLGEEPYRRTCENLPEPTGSRSGP